jgi:glycine oxidase
VDPRKAAVALREAFVRAGGELREHSQVRDILIEGDRVRAVHVAEQTLPAETVILAAGAWSAQIGGLPPAVCPPVHPVKGQMLAVRMPPDAPLIKHTVWGPAADLIPRSDGRLLVGATVEEAGFDTRSTAGGVFKLLRGAGDFFPGIYKLPIVETWAGLRPASPDDAPILGTTPVRGLIMATGHFKRGILFAPLTAKAISHLVLTGEMLDEIKPLSLTRFVTA